MQCLKFMLSLLKAYALLRAMAEALPTLAYRMPKMKKVRKNGYTTLYKGATVFRKEIVKFKQFAATNHTSFNIIKRAYAAAKAATRHLSSTSSYFMVVAKSAPRKPSPSLVGDKYVARTAPVGGGFRLPVTETVRAPAACIKCI
jgi:hypothetical protein